MDEVVGESVPGRTASRTVELNWTTVGATWIVFLLAFPFLETQGFALETLLAGGVVGLPLVIIGFLAASQCRAIPERRNSQRAQLVLFALLAGIGVGAMNFSANVALAATDSSIRALLQEHFADPLTLTRTASVAVVEEVVSRLFLMSAIAWLVARFSKPPRTVFLIALVVSAFVFAVGHLLGRPMPVQPALATLYASGVVLKSGIAGLALGWIFWRWGLFYAVLCHFVANGLHTLLEGVWFS